jgi:hypothetical protein
MCNEHESGGWFLVRRLVPSEDPGEKLSGPVVVACFATYEEAEADRSEREREARVGVNPFELRQGCLAALTSLEPGILADWLEDAGVDPPSPAEDGVRHWHLWWDARMPDVHERVWPSLDKLRFFDVVERPAPPRRVYLVQEVGWHMDEDGAPVIAGPEARRAVEAFTSRQRAGARRGELERESLALYSESGWSQWFDFDVFPDDRAQTRLTQLYEVVEIDLEGA